MAESPGDAGNAPDDGRAYLIVSGDSHAGPPLETHLRGYCPQRLLDEFDEYAALQRRSGELVSGPELQGRAAAHDPRSGSEFLSAEAAREGTAQVSRIRDNLGSYDSAARLADMDEQGITSELIFAGAQNGHELPWMGAFDAGSARTSPELRIVGGHMWNAWLADFTAAAPERLLGVMQIPIWDVAEAVKEIHWGAAHGLRAINFAAPRPDYPSFNEDMYEPLWNAVEEVGLPLVTHSGSGERGAGFNGHGSLMLWMSEVLWFSRRGLGQLIFGGVFDRHPSLLVVFCEQRGNWVQSALAELDSAYYGVPRNTARPLMGAVVEAPQLAPTEYWLRNCAIADSFMAPFEVRMRDEIGITTLIWGSDYPHIEGTWPHTRVALQNTFAGIPESDTRQILQTNGVRVFGLNEERLRPVADRIGPRPADLFEPPAPDALPAYRGMAYRERGSFH
jgi:predicted TIM-barrel fold metal-dependent hydrolase